MKRLLFNAGEWTILCLGLMILPASGKCQQEPARPATVQPHKGVSCENSTGEMACTWDGKSLSSPMKDGLSAPAPPHPAPPPSATRVAPTASEDYPPTPLPAPS